MSLDPQAERRSLYMEEHEKSLLSHSSRARGVKILESNKELDSPVNLKKGIICSHFFVVIVYLHPSGVSASSIFFISWLI
jgi:hypothetical protein